MNMLSSFLVLLLGVCVAQASDPVRVLILSGQNNHDWRTTTPILRQTLEGAGMVVEVTERPDLIEPASLGQVDVILSNWNTYGIVVATPDHWHVPIAIEAARHGKDMYVEKPLGVSLKDQFRLRELMQGKDIVFQYGTQQRSGLFARNAVELVRNGYIGEVTGVDVWSPCLGQDNIGFIAGWGAHPLDICQWGLGMDGSGPVHYEGAGVLPHPDALHNTTRHWDLHCRYPNGVKMRFMDTGTADKVVKSYSQYMQGNGTVFKGSEGWVQYSRGAVYLFMNGDYVNASRFPFRDTDERVYVSNDHMGNFIDCMRSRKPTINPLESAIRSDTISHLSDIVVRTGKAVDWDPGTETIRNGGAEQLALLDRPKRAPYNS